MTHWDEAIAHQTFQFTESLERRGFSAHERTLTGNVGQDDEAVAVEIVVPPGFPFLPPVVTPLTDFPRSWHRERSGAMCLYTEDQRKDLQWLDVDDFLATVARWIKNSRAGWVDDFPDLDLERYFDLADEKLVVYGDLDQIAGNYVQLRCAKMITRLTGSGSIPRKKRLKKDREFGYLLDIGEPTEPPSGWDDLKALIPESEARTVEVAVSNSQIQYLIVRYSRNGIDAAMVLRIWKNKSSIELAFVRSASEAPATLTLRAGPRPENLANVRVAVVGVGAVGSFVCDLLARSGVGAITAYDPDMIRPGNLIRHLADSDAVGVAKPLAVQRAITSRPFNSTTVAPVNGPGPLPGEVIGVFDEHNLVIDATASTAATSLLAAAADACGRHMISACLQEEGMVVRVDIIPPLNGKPIPPTELGPAPARDDLRFEAGCGDPVSQTPAFAVYEAASLAVRHAIGMLTNSPVSDAGTVRDYRK